jgi:hypothetical protein
MKSLRFCLLVLLLVDVAAGWVAPVRQGLLAQYGGASCGCPQPSPRRSVLCQSSSSSSSNSQDGTLSTKRTDVPPRGLDAKQRDFVLGYLNKHHADLLVSFATAFSSLGAEMAIANTWSGGSFTIGSAVLTGINSSNVALDVMVQRRGKPAEQRTVNFHLSADPVPERERSYDKAIPVPEIDDKSINERLPVDDIVRKLCRLCWIVKQPEVSGKLIQLAFQLGGAGVGELPENMYVRH